MLCDRRGVHLGKTQYLPTSFACRLLQGKRIYTRVVCDVG